MGYLTIKDLAKLLNVTDVTVRNWIKRGEAPPHQLTPGRQYRFEEAAVQRWLQESGNNKTKLANE